jgi:hypothetical protein
MAFGEISGLEQWRLSIAQSGKNIVALTHDESERVRISQLDSGPASKATRLARTVAAIA